MRQGYDLCDECYVKLNIKEPVIKFSSQSSISPEKLEDLMPHFKTLFKDMHEGKCQVVYNDGFFSKD